MSANDKQVGGTHYKGGIQVWDFVMSNQLDYLRGNAIKYLSRDKNPMQDLEKALHYIEKLIEVEKAKIAAIQTIKASPVISESDRLAQQDIIASKRGEA